MSVKSLAGSQVASKFKNNVQSDQRHPKIATSMNQLIKKKLQQSINIYKPTKIIQQEAQIKNQMVTLCMNNANYLRMNDQSRNSSNITQPFNKNYTTLSPKKRRNDAASVGSSSSFGKYQNPNLSHNTAMGNQQQPPRNGHSIQ